MKVRGLNSVGDWQFGRGKQSYKADLDALKQSILTRLRQWRGDCFFALDDGVDWNNYLSRGTKDRLDLDVKRVILQTGGVLKISAYESTLDRDTRNLSIAANVATVYGTLALEEIV